MGQTRVIILGAVRRYSLVGDDDNGGAFLHGEGG